MKGEFRSVFAKIWEGIGLVSITLLLCLPNGNTLIDTVLRMVNVKSGKYMGMSVAGLIAMGLFLVVYFSSFKIFPKEKFTKLFSLVASMLMILTLISKIMFA